MSGIIHLAPSTETLSWNFTKASAKKTINAYGRRSIMDFAHKPVKTQPAAITKTS